MEFLTVILILISLFIGWNIGANDAANCMGPSVGAGILNYRKAAILVGVFALIGAFLQGGNTIGTVGKEVVNPAMLSQLSIVCALFGAAILVTFFTKKGIPVSTTQAIIGALAGIAIINNINVNWGIISKMFIAWVLTPLIAALFSFLAYHALAYLFRNFRLEFLQKKLYLAVIGSGILLSYSMGANNIGNAMGMVVSTKTLSIMAASLIGGIFLALGSISFGKNVMKTVGKKITELDSRMAFSVQSGSAITLYILTMLAIPVSTSTAVVGGVAGVGLVKGVAAVNKSQVFRIIQSWFFTPIAGGVFAIIIFKLASLIL